MVKIEEVELGKRSNIDTRFSFEASLDIVAGINSGILQMSITLIHIIKIWQKKFPGEPLTIDIFTQIADKSYSCIANIATLHKVFLRGVPDEMEFFDLIPCTYADYNDSFRLKLTEEGRAKIQEQENAEIKPQDQGPTVGCPAIIQFNNQEEGSVLNQIWNQYLDLIVQVHKEQRLENHDFSVFDLLPTKK